MLYGCSAVGRKTEIGMLSFEDNTYPSGFPFNPLITLSSHKTFFLLHNGNAVYTQQQHRLRKLLGQFPVTHPAVECINHFARKPYRGAIS